MAIIIKELHIKAIAVQDKKQAPAQPAPQGGPDLEEAIQAAVQASVKEVMKILGRKNKR